MTIFLSEPVVYDFAHPAKRVRDKAANNIIEIIFFINKILQVFNIITD